MINTRKLNKLTLITLSWLMLFTLQASAQTNSANEINIDKKPLQDFVDSVIESQNKNKLDLTKPFLVTVKGELTDQGTFDTTSRYLIVSGDPKVIQLVKSGIEAIGESKFLQYLTALDIKNFKLTVMQDDNNFSIQLVSVMKSPPLAKNIASGLNMLFATAKNMKQNEINGDEIDAAKLQSEKDEAFVLQNTSVTSQNKNFVLQIKLPKAKAHEMLKRNLEKEVKKRNK